MDRTKHPTNSEEVHVLNPVRGTRALARRLKGPALRASQLPRPEVAEKARRAAGSGMSHQDIVAVLRPYAVTLDEVREWCSA